MKRRPIQLGEALAIDPKAIQRDADGIFVLFSPEIPENEYAQGVACVHIRGPLDHHAGFGDNYDAIRERAREAFECDEASAVIFRIDSPGGAVSGLYDTVRAIRGMAEASEKRTVAYVDERAFSAAYALSCACDEIVLPESGLTGSIGVISTMADQVEHDRAAGFNFVTITSGARKADGHIHVPISEEAVAVEAERVEELAVQFFQMVKESRGLSLKTVRGFEAGLFLGAHAVDAGVADRVETFDELFAELCDPAHPGGAARLDTPGTHESASTSEVSAMNIRGALLEELKTAKALLAKAKPAERAALRGKVDGVQASLEAYKKVTEKRVEHSRTHEEDEGDEDEEGNETDRDDDEEGDEDDKKGASSAKSKSKAAAKSKSRAESEDEDEEEARYDEEEEAKALVSIVRGATGKRGAAAEGALAGLLAKAKAADRLAARVEKLEQEKDEDRRSLVIKAALDSRRLTASEAKDLRKRPMAYIDAFLAARPKSLVWTSEGDMPVPAAASGGSAVLTPELEKQIAQAMSATGLTREAIVASFDAESAKLNGKGGIQ